MAAVHLNRHGKSGLGSPLQHGFLRAAAAGLLIAERHRLNATHQIGEGGVFDQVFDGIAMGRGHEHHATLGNGASRLGFQLGADLVNNDHLGHVVFHGLDHHLVLKLRPGYLHAPGAADGGMGNVAIPSDFIAGVNHHHPLAQVVGQHPGDLAQGGGLAHTRAPHQQQRLAGIEQVAHHGHCAKHCSAHPAGESHDRAGAVADRTDAMQGALNAGTVVAAEAAESLHHCSQVGALQGLIAQGAYLARVAGLGHPAQVEHNLQQLLTRLGGSQGRLHHLRQQGQQAIEVVGDALGGDQSRAGHRIARH